MDDSPSEGVRSVWVEGLLEAVGEVEADTIVLANTRNEGMRVDSSFAEIATSPS